MLFLPVGLALAGCSGFDPQVGRAASPAALSYGTLYPGETREMRALIRKYAQIHDIPEALLHRVIQRESNYRPHARNGPYWGLMQIMPETARQMGFRGRPEELLDAETNLRYAGRYLRGAWLVSNGNIDRAVMWYARGFYFEARDRCMLVETGLRAREVRRDCPVASPAVARRT
ncbi:MAG: transglycosylase SLT domain-containing protein [Roseinatronobacter sp.]